MRMMSVLSPDVGVVPDVAAGGSEVDDTLGLRALQTIGVDVAHDIVTHDLLPRLRVRIIHIVRMGLQLIDLLLGDIEPQLLLGLREGDPELSPGAEFLFLRKEVLHLLARIPLGKRAGILRVILRHVVLLYDCNISGMRPLQDAGYLICSALCPGC